MEERILFIYKKIFEILLIRERSLYGEYWENSIEKYELKYREKMNRLLLEKGSILKKVTQELMELDIDQYGLNSSIESEFKGEIEDVLSDISIDLSVESRFLIDDWKEKQFGKKDREIEWLRNDLEEKSFEIDDLENQVSERELEIKNYEQNLLKNKKEIEYLTKELKEKDTKINGLEEILNKREKEIKKYEQEIKDKRKELDAVIKDLEIKNLEKRNPPVKLGVLHLTPIRLNF